MCEQNIVDSDVFRRTNEQFYLDYCRGELNVEAALKFALQPLTRFSMAELDELHQRFMAIKIKPMLLDKARDLVASHRCKGHTLMVITATNRFVTEPIVKEYGIDHLIASEGEIIDGRYSGEVLGTPSYAEGKVTRLHAWLETEAREHSLGDAYFYSDSHNDIPLLNQVGKPVAVDPDDKLRDYANKKHWPCISLR